MGQPQKWKADCGACVSPGEDAYRAWEASGEESFSGHLPVLVPQYQVPGGRHCHFEPAPALRGCGAPAHHEWKCARGLSRPDAPLCSVLNSAMAVIGSWFVGHSNCAPRNNCYWTWSSPLSAQTSTEGKEIHLQGLGVNLWQKLLPTVYDHPSNTWGVNMTGLPGF